jgi:hypothetical protein
MSYILKKKEELTKSGQTRAEQVQNNEYNLLILYVLEYANAFGF